MINQGAINMGAWLAIFYIVAEVTIGHLELIWSVVAMAIFIINTILWKTEKKDDKGKDTD